MFPNKPILKRFLLLTYQLKKQKNHKKIRKKIAQQKSLKNLKMNHGFGINYTGQHFMPIT